MRKTKASLPTALSNQVQKHYEYVPFIIDFFREKIFLHSLTYKYITTHSLINKNIVEIGCSHSYIGQWLQQRYPNYKYLGVDLNKKAVRMARLKGINVIFGNNLNLKLLSNSSDLTISEGVIHHTPDPYKCFQELVRITKKGGVISLYVYNKNHIYFLVYKVFGAPCRLIHRFKSTRFISEKILFLFYNLFYIQLGNRLFLKYPQSVPREVAYSLYYDQVLTPIATFYKERDILEWASNHKLKLLESKKSINGQGLLFLFKK